jgi:hypothetical protein
MIENILYAIELISFTGVVAFSLFFFNWKHKNVALLVSYVIFSVALFASMFMLLGKPVSPNALTAIEYRIDKGHVVYVRLDEGKQILLLIDVPNETSPIYIKLPWDQETASKIQSIMNQQKAEAASGQVGKMEMIKPMSPGENSLETRKDKFKHTPPPGYHPIEKPLPQERIFH